MTNPDTQKASTLSITELESRLADGGRYYRLFLQPALEQGLAALDPQQRQILRSRFTCEAAGQTGARRGIAGMPESDAEPDSAADQALRKLQLAIAGTSGLYFDQRKMLSVLVAAGEAEITDRLLRETLPASQLDHGTTARRAPVQIVITPQHLQATLSPLFGSIRKSVNFVGRSRPFQRARSFAESRDGISVLSVPHGRLIADRWGRLHFATDIVTAGPLFLRVAWPEKMDGVSVRLQRGENADAPNEAWALVGHLDSTDRLSLTIDGSAIPTLDSSEPVAFSCSL